jgi:hypothetical protein
MKKNMEGFNKFKFIVFFNDNIICRRNYFSKKNIEEINPHYDEVIKLIENYINVENAKFHHNVLVKFSYLQTDVVYNITLHCEKYKIMLKPILGDIIKILELRNPKKEEVK